MTLGGPPVTILDAGGLPVTNTTNALPLTVATAPHQGMPVTIADNAYPVTLLNEDGSAWSAVPPAPHASDLLDGEAQGLAIDFTLGSGLGEVAVIDTGTPANNKNNVPVDSFLTQSGTSPKLVLGATGVYGWSPHNMWLSSQTFDNAVNWAKNGCSVTADAVAAPDGTLTADALIEDATLTIHYTSQFNASLVVGATYTFSAYLKKNTRNYALLYSQNENVGKLFDLTAGAATANVNNPPVSASIVDAGNGWWRCSITVLCVNSVAVYWIGLSTDGVGFTYTGDGASGIYIWGAQLNRGAVPTAYLPTTSAGARVGVPIEYGGGGYYALVEPQATNLILWSQALDNALWVKGDTTITANAIAAPDGTLTADKLAEAATSAPHMAYQSATVTTGTPYTFSACLKAGERTWAYLRSDSAVANEVWFDLANGVVGSAGIGYTATITPLGNGWYRCSVTVSPTGTTWYNVIGTATANAVGSHAGVAGSGIYAWGAQLELGSVATSPIPTFAATVTRAADNINVATSAFPYALGGPGTAIWEGVDRAVVGVGYATFSNGSTQELVLLYTSAGVTHFQVRVGGGIQGTLTGLGAVVASAVLKLAGAWSVSELAAVQDGGTVSSAAATLAPSPTALALGADIAGFGVTFHGRVRRFTYVPRRMTNVELQTKTTP